MVLLVCGSRSITDKDWVYKEIDRLDRANGPTPGKIAMIVSGGAKGVDSVAEHWAADHAVPCKVMKPDWNKEGTVAGLKRNERMVIFVKSEGGCILALWDGKSKGTEHTMKLAGDYRVPLFCVLYTPPNQLELFND